AHDGPSSRWILNDNATLIDSESEPELVRALAKLAGVHLYTEGKATVWATDGYLSFQAHEAGPLTIDVGRKTQVSDALDGRPLGMGPTVTLTVTQGETRVLKY
ncbi:MAG: hypothetical protein WCP21_09620, partial [Armatimonadota bacterium]